MKKLFLLFFIIFISNLYCQNIEITTTDVGQISTILGDDEDYLVTIESLKINGPLNVLDLKFIANLLTPQIVKYKLKHLDLSEASVPNNIWRSWYMKGGTLRSIKFPKSLVKIDHSSFAWSDNITSVTLYEGLEYIGVSVLAWANLTEVNLPSTLKYLGDRSFTHCSITQINCYSIIPPQEVVLEVATMFKDTVDGEIYTYEANLAVGAGYGDRRWKGQYEDGLGITCIIHCPIGTKKEYRKHPWFGQFSYIVQDLPNISTKNEDIYSIDNFKIVNNEIISENDLLVYDISGKAINWKNIQLNQGIYIVYFNNCYFKISI